MGRGIWYLGREVRKEIGKINNKMKNEYWIFIINHMARVVKFAICGVIMGFLLFFTGVVFIKTFIALYPDWTGKQVQELLCNKLIK